MQNVIVGSMNPVKINGVKSAFEELFHGEEFNVEGFNADSGVSDQPMTAEETRLGAENRIKHLKMDLPDADYYAAIEGGIDEKDGAMFTFAAVVIESKSGTRGISTTAQVQIPPRVAELVKSGKELGHANDEVFGAENSKHSSGATGLLTDGILERTEFYRQAIILALVPFKNKDLY